ncbi:MAG: PhzF family phenazine biosynthesis protein [Desulfobulbus sp.]|nr:PhzF family phenazine biosynthesis protein [Desulfobulbus sp.]
MTEANYFHVDVFATRALTGNGLAVFLDTDEWPSTVMQSVTQEMRQFESIFLSDTSTTGATARVFTVEEELPFARHPVLGAAAVLHRKFHPACLSRTWTLKLPSGLIEVKTTSSGNAYLAEMDQGEAVTGAPLTKPQLLPLLERLGLETADLAPGLPAQVLSTGLPYLILPVRAESLSRSAINGTDLEALLVSVGAKFVLVLDAAGREMRTWDNLGRVEDVATGSAAGPAAAYLFTHNLADPDAPLELAQGRFAGRPSKLKVTRNSLNRLSVSGEVWPVAHGSLEPEFASTHTS